MGRRKLEIKRIEKLSQRNATYSKRKNGLLKKVNEISVLCDAQVSLIIISSSGNIHNYVTPSTTLSDVVERYYNRMCDGTVWDSRQEKLSKEIDRMMEENERMEKELMHLKGENITSMNDHKKLMGLEETLERGLQGVREKMVEVHKRSMENVKILEEENRNLYSQLLHHLQVQEVVNWLDACIRA